VTNDDAWVLALVIGLAAALIVTVLLLLLIRACRDIESSVGGLLEVAGKVAGNTANIPAKCGVSVPYGDISASVDCSKVN
jgi:hypothetical protein